MSYTQGDISAIFLYKGCLILTCGMTLAWAFGAIITYAISKIPIHIRGIFTTDSFVVNWSLSHYLWATAITTIVVLIASYIPARRAAKLDPALIVREAKS